MPDLSKYDVLSRSTFGQRVAEEEGDTLTRYFVETDHWKRLISGDVDVIYGMKGAGKSALYSLLWARRSELFDRNIILAPAENPRGAPAFRGLVADPPATEREFIGLWKLYIASLGCGVLDEFQVTTKDADFLRTALRREGLVRGERNLASLLRSVFDYAKGALRPSGLEAGINIDPVTNLPAGFTGKITFHEPSPVAKQKGMSQSMRSWSLQTRPWPPVRSFYGFFSIDWMLRLLRALIWRRTHFAPFFMCT